MKTVTKVNIKSIVIKQFDKNLMVIDIVFKKYTASRYISKRWNLTKTRLGG